MIYPLSMFNTGQVTLPKKWRDKIKTKYFVAQETSDGGLLIKPLEEVMYYEVDDDNFGLSFPMGIPAKDLAKNLKKANGKIS